MSTVVLGGRFGNARHGARCYRQTRGLVLCAHRNRDVALDARCLRRGVFHSVPDLIAKIEDYLAAHNTNPKPFVWTATTQDILAKVARGRVALQAVNQ